MFYSRAFDVGALSATIRLRIVTAETPSVTLHRRIVPDGGPVGHDSQSNRDRRGLVGQDSQAYRDRRGSAITITHES